MVPATSNKTRAIYWLCLTEHLQGIGTTLALSCYSTDLNNLPSIWPVSVTGQIASMQPLISRVPSPHVSPPRFTLSIDGSYRAECWLCLTEHLQEVGTTLALACYSTNLNSHPSIWSASVTDQIASTQPLISRVPPRLYPPEIYVVDRWFLQSNLLEVSYRAPPGSWNNFGAFMTFH